MEKRNSLLKVTIKFIAVDKILAGIIFYAFGVSFSRYLGFSTNWIAYLTGQLVVSFLQLTGIFLQVYFDTFDYKRRSYIYDNLNEKLTPKRIVEIQRILLFISISMLLMTSVFMFLLYFNIGMNTHSIIFVGIYIICILFFSVPPIFLVHTVYAEIFESFIITCLLPAIAYTLQGHPLHRMIPFIALPMFLLFFSMQSIISLKNFRIDSKYENNTLTTRLGWKKNIRLHNYSLVFSYLLLVLNLWFWKYPGGLSGQDC